MDTPTQAATEAYERVANREDNAPDWSVAQKPVVDEWVAHMADEIDQRLSHVAESRVRKLDNRPKRFLYVEQAMLEALISELQDRV